jgi:hypothetical protein
MWTADGTHALAVSPNMNWPPIQIRESMPPNRSA